MQYAHKPLTIYKTDNTPTAEAIDDKFGNNVKVFTLRTSFNYSKSDIQNNLCIVIASLQAFR